MNSTPVTNPRRFALAGNATFTVVSKKTATRFTYQIQAPKLNRDGEPVSKEQAEVLFVKVLNGPDNTSNYEMFGMIFPKDGKFVPWKKSRISMDAPCAAAFKWTFENVLVTGVNHPKLEVHHSGTCGRCGRKLTVPESIQSGLGPECATKVGC